VLQFSASSSSLSMIASPAAQLLTGLQPTLLVNLAVHCSLLGHRWPKDLSSIEVTCYGKKETGAKTSSEAGHPVILHDGTAPAARK